MVGTITEKLDYTRLAVIDIQKAINEKKVECGDTVPLKEYGDKIRAIKSKEKPTFCPWQDFQNIYYIIDENDIEYTNKFYNYDKMSNAISFNNDYTILAIKDIVYTNKFAQQTITPKTKTYTNI